MVLRSFEGSEPTIHDSAYVDETAVIIGDVTIEQDASIWPNTTLRGDHGEIVIREGANVQDNAVCHEGVEIGPYATVGHTAIVHAATVGERALIGMQATVLDGATIGDRALIGAGSVVTENTDIPPSSFAIGTPAEVKRTDDETPWTYAGDHYVELANRYQEHSERLD